VTVELSVYELILEASLVVQLVMLLLLGASVVSWTMIFLKWRTLRDASRSAKAFEDRFWSGVDVTRLFEGIQKKDHPTGMEHIFAAGFREYARLHKQQRLSPQAVSDTAQRAMRVALSREIDALETYLSFLATVGSTAPYVGLFGTVWGIMHAFMSLSGVQQATLQAVAPGIAEALIATAIGLFAAIPAVIAYNRYANDVDRLVTRYDNFQEEFVALLQRQALNGERRESAPAEASA
jgi:biopolymer transport protein TolQ